MKIPPKLSALSLLVLACALAALLAAVPPAGVCVTARGVYIQGWLSSAVRWSFFPLAIALCAGGWALWRFAQAGLGGSRLAALSPLAFLPAAVALPHVLAWFDHTLAGLVLPLGGTFLGAMVLEGFLRPGLDAPPTAIHRSGRTARLWFGAAFLVLFAFHHGIARMQRFGSGDVGYYLTQTQNLVERGNLDLTDCADAMMAERGIAREPDAQRDFLDSCHMKMNKAGRVYSYHSFGFPLLAWPFSALFGRWGEGVLLALLGAMALCGVRAACLAHGAPRRAADAVSLLTGMSYMWVYTAMSYLPEMLGFGLVAWAFWAVAEQGQSRRRWLATLAATATCAYLPVAHVRFMPTAGMLAACFGIEGLCLRGESFLKGKTLRLGLFSLACFGAWGGLWAIHSVMFQGTAAYDYSNIAGREPLAMWAIFADRRGVMSVVPAVSAFLMATVAALFRKDTVVRHAAMALVIAAATLWFCCCTPEALRGTCLNGRYFYVLVPLFLPFFAIALRNAPRPGRLWMLFLSLLPVAYLLFLAPFLSGGDLVFAPNPVRGFLNLSLFWDPFSSFFGGDGRRTIGSLFVLTLFGLSGLACTRRGGFLRVPAAVILLAAAFVFGRAGDRTAPVQRRCIFPVLAGEGRFRDFKVLGKAPSDFFSAFRDESPSPRAMYVLSDDPAQVRGKAGRVERPADLAVDARNGRAIRWGDVQTSFTSLGGTGGFAACRATGRVLRGTARLGLQIDGAEDMPGITLPEGPFDATFLLRVFDGNGGAKFRLALEDDAGEACVCSTDYYPCPPALPAKLGGFPSSTTVVEVSSGQ